MGKKDDGRGNVRYLWILVGGYLLYLAWKQARLLLGGYDGGGALAAIAALSVAVFAAAGAFVLYREWASWRDARKKDSRRQEEDED